MQWFNYHIPATKLVLIIGTIALIQQGLTLKADEITAKVLGKDVTLSGTVKFENDNAIFLETPNDYSYRILKTDVKTRMKQDAPAALSAEEYAKQVPDEFRDKALVRTKVTDDVIAVLILASPLPDGGETRVDKVLKQIETVYQDAAQAVKLFAKKYKLPQKEPKLPAVVCIYESDSAAEARFDNDVGQDEQTLRQMCGWYDPTSGFANFQMSEVTKLHGTFTDTLVWQQLYHTGMLQRHAPVPLWFKWGVAMGFMASDTKISPDHPQLNSFTFKSLQEALEDGGKLADWDQMVSEPLFFENADGFDMEQCRDQAWGLHWYLINKNKAAYTRYWKMMSDLSPADNPTPQKYLADFKKTFTKTGEGFKPLFKKVFQVAAQNPPPIEIEPDDKIFDSEQWGTIKLHVIGDVSATSEIRCEGVLTNSSPFRTLSFCVCFTSNKAKIGVWFVDKLEPGKSAELKALFATTPKTPGKKKVEDGEVVIDNYWIESALPDSEQAAKWRKGELPTGD